MSFNTRKCNTLRVTTKKNPIVHTYSMGTDVLETVSHHPYLGVELSSNLKWTHHINIIAARANKALWFIRRNLWRCPKSVKQQMYFALVRPHLEVACVRCLGSLYNIRNLKARRNKAQGSSIWDQMLQEDRGHGHRHFPRTVMTIPVTTKAIDPAPHHVLNTSPRHCYSNSRLYSQADCSNHTIPPSKI